MAVLLKQNNGVLYVLLPSLRGGWYGGEVYVIKLPSDCYKICRVS
jgi:hypothetical protein